MLAAIAVLRKTNLWLRILSPPQLYAGFVIAGRGRIGGWRGEAWPLTKILQKKQGNSDLEALCTANEGLRARLEREVEPMKKELAKQERLLAIRQTQLKVTTTEITRLKKDLTGKADEKTKPDLALKAEEKKLKPLRGEDPNLKRLIEQLQKTAPPNHIAWTKAAGEVRGLTARKKRTGRRDGRATGQEAGSGRHRTASRFRSPASTAWLTAARFLAHSPGTRLRRQPG